MNDLDRNITMPHQTDEWNAFDDGPTKPPRKRWVFDWRSYWLGVVATSGVLWVIHHVQ